MMELKEFWDRVEELNEGRLPIIRPPEQKLLSEEEEQEIPRRRKNRLESKFRWRRDMMIAIRAASIAVQSQEFIKRGRGAPDTEDMCRFNEEAEGVAKLWRDTYLAECDELAGVDRGGR